MTENDRVALKLNSKLKQLVLAYEWAEITSEQFLAGLKEIFGSIPANVGE